MRSSLLIALLALTSACGPREPGFAPHEQLSWRIESSEVTFDHCSDADFWREPFAPPDVSTGAFYISVAIDETGREALLMRCNGFNACSVAQPEVRFTVAGTELVHGSNSRLDIQNSSCKVAVAEGIVIVDEGATMTLQNSLTFTLVENDAACADFEANVRGQSPNGLGVNGCVVTVHMRGSL